jgi:hypothetical protein
MFTTTRGEPMLQKAFITGAAAAIVGLGVGGASLASADGETSDRQFVLIEHQVSQHFVDLGDAGLSVGDHAVFRSVFTTPSRAHAGDVNVVCTLVGKATVHCNATARLHDGTLELGGLFDITSPDIRLAIIGGTGAFDRAHGQLSSHHLHGNISRDTFDIDA